MGKKFVLFLVLVMLVMTSPVTAAAMAQPEEAQTPQPQAVVKVKKVSLDKKRLTMTIGDEAALTYKVSPENATDTAVTYTSSNASVASVDGDGKITALKKGSATITARAASGAKAKCAVKVLAPPPNGISLDTDSVELSVKGKARLTASVTPGNASSAKVKFTSSNTAVATVDKTGKVTGVKAGSASILAATSSGLVAVCNVTVTDGSAAAVTVTLNKKILQLFTNTSETLAATVYPANAADKSVTYSSNNAAVAVVDSNGKVSALKEGSATITVTAAGGATDACLVTVTNASSTLDTLIEVVRLCNVERQKAGLGALSMDAMLNVAADIRSRELVTRFDHTRPDGTDCLTVFGPLGITCRVAGENVAMGQRTPSEVMKDWMNSEGHRANILRAGFGKIGVGVYRGSNGVVYWTQLFTN